MSIEEFSNSFDVLLNSYSQDIKDPIACDEYEKSVFLTQSQEEVALSLYRTFEQSEESRKALSNLVKQIEVPVTKNTNGISNDSYQALLSADVWFIVYESVDFKKEAGCLNYTNVEVVPVSHDTFHRIKNNPFRGVNDKRVLRLDIKFEGNNKIELISNHTIVSYKYRYLQKLTPIVTAPLGALEIRGYSTPINSVLNDTYHDAILQLAVQKAIQTKLPKTNKGSDRQG